MSELTKDLASQNGNQASAMLGELTGDELLAQNGNQAGSAMGELTDDELLAQNGNQAGVGVAKYFDELDKRPKPKYLTFTAGEGGASVGFIVYSKGYELPEDYTKPSFQYSTDGGKTWQDYDLQVSDATADATLIELAEGASVMLKGVNDNLACYIEGEDDWVSVQAQVNGSVAASGDITSLLNGVGGDVAMQPCCCAHMFEGCTGLTSSPALPSTTLAEMCYSYMFGDCTDLTSAPALLATTLAVACYSGMFNHCINLTSAPALPAKTLADECYESTFTDCGSIISHDVATLNQSPYVFDGNTSCASLTIHAATPPEIGEDTITGLKADCIIYVPAASVDAYKAAQYWSERADYIQAIP